MELKINEGKLAGLNGVATELFTQGSEGEVIVKPEYTTVRNIPTNDYDKIIVGRGRVPATSSHKDDRK